MKRILAVVLAVLATVAIAAESSPPTCPQRAAIHDIRERSVAIMGDQPGRTKTAPSQVYYQVTLARDGIVLRSFNFVTDDGKQVTATSEDTVAYQASCDATTDCSTGESHSGLFLSLIPRVGPDGTILTICEINVSALRRADDFSTTSEFFTYRGQEMRISHGGLSLTIRARVV